MKRIKQLTVCLLAAGLAALIIGAGLFMSGQEAVRPEKTFDDYMDDAELYVNNSDYYKAVVSYENALSEEPDNLEALSGLAEVYSRQSDFESEGEIRSQITEIAPDDLDNQIRIIEILIHNEDYKAAKTKTEELMQENDSDALRSLYSEMNIAVPVFNLESGSYEEYQLLQLTTSYDNALVYYTTDGSEPDSGSLVYDDGIVISYPETVIRAKAIGFLGFESEEVQLSFSVSKDVEAISLRNSNTLYRIASAVFNRSWNSTVYNYELAQIREIYLLGNYYVDTEMIDAEFYNGYYVRYSSQYTDLGSFTLDFVYYTPFLKTLSAGYQKNLDLTPLSSLQYLENLSLLNDQITDISALSGLSSLRQLALGWNGIADVSALSGLTELESLGLWNNNISDVSVLSTLTRLTYFDIAYNDVSDISCVSRMPNLSEVWMNNNNIQDISVLDNCEKLMVLMLAGNPISEYGSVRENSIQFYKTDLK